ncbi:MAG: hypothetical protein ABEL76_02500, partial [Bradymonadaceae bacterium]
LEMARSGARVLNEEAVEYARRADIALYTREAHGEGDGQTVVRSEAFERRVERAERGLPAVAVTHLDEGLYAYADDGGRDLLDDVRDRELSLCNWSPPDEAEVFVDLEEVYAPETIRRRLDESGTSVGRAGLVSVVGQGIGRRSEWTLEGQRVLKEGGLSPIAVGVEAARLSWVVPEGESAEATRRLHGRFVEGDSDSSGSSE